MRSLSIVIPTLDGGDMLTDCVAAVAGDDEIVIVDNGSTDGSVERVARAHPDVIIVRNETNVGYAAACNQGAAAARGRFVLFLNNDALLDRTNLDRLLAAAEADEASAIWQPVTLAPDGSVESAGDLSTWWGILRHVDDVPAAPTPVFATVGAALLVRRSVFDALGGFDASYFAYYEESDLCWRARLGGHEVTLVPQATVTHAGGTTSGRIFAIEEIRYLSFRNRLRTILSNASATTLVRMLPLHLLACMAFVAVYTLTGRLRSAGAVLRALARTVRERDVVAHRRRRVRSEATVRDDVVFRREVRGTFSPAAAWRHVRRHLSWWDQASGRRDELVSRNTRKS